MSITKSHSGNTSHIHGTLSDVQEAVEDTDSAAGHLVLGMALAMLSTKTESLEFPFKENEEVDNAPVTLSVSYNEQGDITSMGMTFTEGVPDHG